MAWSVTIQGYRYPVVENPRNLADDSIARVANGRRFIRNDPMGASAGYLTALAIGLLLTFSIFPHWALVGGLPPGAPPRPDFGKDVLGQLYFFAQTWDFDTPTKILLDRKLNAPWGASIAMTDSIPLLTILTKLLRPILPPFDQSISIFQAAAWVLQPVAATFALRSTGERRWLPAVAVSLLSVCMPTLLFRLWHTALTGHFLLLTMLGLYLRIMRGSGRALAWACILQVALLLIHPYLMLMATALLLAAPLSLFLRGDARWRNILLAIVLSSLVAALTGYVLGYWGAGSDGGFGYYSMNLASPFWPTFSALIPGIPYAALDATGGQGNGYQYLGLGMLGLLAVSALGWRLWRAAIRRHPGLALACIALSAISVTNWVFFLHTRILHVPLPSTLFSQVRASGRCFWPVTYTLLIASAVVTLRAFPRTGSLILLASALVQFADTRDLRLLDHSALADPTPYPFDQQRLAALLGAHGRLTLLPTFPCNGGGTPTAVDLLWVAGRTHMATNGMYMARESHDQDCLPREISASRPEPGEIRAILPGFEPMLAVLPDSAHDCRVLAPYILCTRQVELLAGLPAYPVRSVPMSVALSVRAGTPGADTLLAGWTFPDPAGGAWSVAPTAFLGARLTPQPMGPLRITIAARAMPVANWPRRASTTRPVSVWIGTRHLADWKVGPKLSTFEAVVPADAIQGRDSVMIELRNGPPSSMLDLGRGTDPRRFGIWLESLSFSPAG